MQALIAKAVGAFLVLILAFGLGYTYRDAEATKEALQLTKEHIEQLEDLRVRTQRGLNAISEEWKKHLEETQSKAAGTIARLNADGVRLRIQLADATKRSTTGDCRPEPDGRAELHPDAAGFLIRQAQRADAQVKALQEVIRTLQGGDDGKTEK
jgi:hypothetical protein